MKILKELDDAKLVIVDLEVRLGDEVRSAPTLCAKYKGKNYTLLIQLMMADQY